MKSAVRQTVLFRQHGPLAPYLGIVGTRGFLCAKSITTLNKQAQLRTFHYMRDNVAYIRLFFADFYTQAETASGANTTINASIENATQGGARTQVTFGGSATGTLPNGGTLLSDEISFSAAMGDKVYLHQFRQNSSGFLFNAYIFTNVAGGDLCRLAASDLTDLTMSGIPTSNVVNCLPMCFILSTTRRPSFLLLGDSRVNGVTDDGAVSGTSAGDSNTAGDLGELSRSIGKFAAYGMGGIVGELAADLTSADTKRLAMAQYASHVIFNHGINDVRANATLSTIKTRLQAMWALFAGSGRKLYHTTIAVSEYSGSPETTNGVRTAVNDWLRTKPTGIDGYFELADIVETSRNSGAWKAGYTNDKLHESATGYQAIEDSGIMTAANF